MPIVDITSVQKGGAYPPGTSTCSLCPQFFCGVNCMMYTF